VTAKSPRQITIIGEVMVEISDLDLGRGQAAVGIAGDSFNTAVHLARRLPAQEWRVAYATQIGRDSMSDQIVALMAAEGISSALVGRHPTRLPGIYAIERDARGERSFRYWRSEAAARRLFSEGEPELSALGAADAVFLSLISLAILPAAVRTTLIGTLTAMRRRGALIAFDSNFRPALWPDVAAAREVAAQMWQATTLALPSRDDEAKLWPDETPQELFARLAGHGVEEIALKDGAAGPQLWVGGPLICGPFAPAERVVDTSGAGDAFNAGYLGARMVGESPAQAAMHGHALACEVIGHRGAILRRAG